MREDEGNESFRSSDVWGHQRYTDALLDAPDKYSFEEGDPRSKKKFVTNSLSGNERNRLFMRTGDNFADVSLLSGLDNTGDGRSFALFDYNRDGFVDIALTSLNVPRFKLLENQFGKIYPENKVLRLELIGGKTDASPSTDDQLSNRDAIGTRVRVTYESGTKALFQKQAGEGFSSQNSPIMRVGVPKGDQISKVEIMWPRGKETVIESPELDEVLTVNESQD